MAQTRSHSATHLKVAESDPSVAITVARAFEVLRCYTPSTPHLGISEIARMTGLAKATVSRMTYTLERLGYLHRLMPTGKYRLGWGVLSLGYPLLTSTPLRHLVQPAMHALAKDMDANVNLGTIEGLDLIYIATARSDETSAARPDIGVRRSIFSTVTGRTLLQSLPARQREALCNRLRLDDEAGWNEGRPRLDAARKDLTRRGFHIGRNTAFPSIVVVAAPVRVPEYESPLVINCAVPQIRAGQENAERIGSRLVRMAQTLGEQLGYR